MFNVMNEEQKNKAKGAHGKLAGWLAGLGVPGNWAKVIAGAVIGALAAVGVLTMSGCGNVTPVQVHAAHELYHVMTGTECQLAKPNTVMEDVTAEK